MFNEDDGFLEKRLQNALDNLLFDDTISMLQLLAKHLNQETKRVAVPNGMRWYKYVIIEPDTYPGQVDVNHKAKVVEFKPFFGMMIAYIPEIDTLAYWKER